VFKAIEKMKDRESLFNDYLSELRKQEKEEKQHSEKEQRKKSYLAMLKELRHLHKHSSWTETKKLLENDPRYKAIESSSKREDYFRDYCKYLDEKPSSSSHNGDSKSRSDKHDKRSDKHKSSGDEKRQSSKDKDKDKERDKKESNKMEQDVEEEETNGRDHHRSSRTATEAENGKEEGEANDDEEMQEAETLEDEEERRKEKEKQERVEASLRERNKEVKEQLSKLHSEREKERQQLKKDELVESFKALLIDLIKTNLSQPPAPSAETSASNSSSSSSKPSELTWKEAKKILKRDSRWSYCKPLEKEKKEALFDEHMNKFRAKKRDLFYQLLDDTAASISLKSSTWKEVKKMIKADPRYEKIQQSDSFKMEKEFEVYLNERFQKSKDDFKELLAQTKLITYKTHTTLKEQPGHMKELEELLSNDKSWIVLNCAPEERKQMLLEYIEQLNKDGPPPPPTATEPTKPRVK
jgi:transcription elongation regulator 1